jgi:APA family basic amino acid/polyamine antiporter
VPPQSKSTRARLGIVSLVSLVIANMIGAGVFTTSGFALADLGSPHRVMLAWLIGGLVALCGALSYGGLAKRITESGGEYVFLARLVHPLAGFLAGWVSLLAGFTAAIAFAALAFETYTAGFLPLVLPRGVIAVLVILLAMALHGIRVQSGAFVQNGIVMLKVGLMAVFLMFAWSAGLFGGPGAAPPPAPAFSAMSFANVLVWISLSYSGFNAAVYVAGEAEQPARAVPRALWLGTLIVTVLYLGLNAAFVYLPHYEQVVGRPDIAAATALSLGGDVLMAVVSGIIALALVTSVFSMMMAGPRVYARMADDGLFPRRFAFRGDAPRSAIGLQALLAVIVVLIADLKNLLSYLGLTLSLSAAATVASLFLLRYREGPGSALVWGFPFPPALFVGATLLFAALAASRSPIELLAAVVTIASGCIAFAVIRRYQ